MTEDDYKQHCDALILSFNEADAIYDYPTADAIVAQLIEGHPESKRVIKAACINQMLKLTAKQFEAAFRRKAHADAKAQQQASSEQRGTSASAQLKAACGYDFNGSNGEITERDFAQGFIAINYPQMDYGARFTKAADGKVCEKHEVERDVVLTACSDFKLNHKPCELKIALFKDAVTELVAKRRAERREAIWQTINGYSDGRMAETINRATRRLFHHVFRNPEMAEAAIRHVIWAIKRKMQRLEIGEHHAVFFYGPQDSGKSRFWSYLKAPIRDLCKNIDVADLTDSKQLDIFRYSLLDCDEIAKHERADLAKFKSVVTADFMSRRRYYTQEMEDVPMSGVVVGTTNKRIKTLFQDETGMRRFIELAVKGRKQVPDWQTEVVEFDWLGLWQSVDHRAEDPLSDFMEELRAEQDNMRTKDRIEQFLDYFEFEPSHLAKGGRGWVAEAQSDPPFMYAYQATKLFDAYKAWEEHACGKSRGMALQTFQDRMKEFIDHDDQPYPHWSYGGGGHARRCYYYLRKTAEIIPLPHPKAADNASNL